MTSKMELRFWCVAFTILSIWDAARGMSILGIVSSPSKSHSVFANAIFEEYANSGHSITVLSPYDVSRKFNHFKIEGIDKFRKNFRSNWNLEVDEYTAKLLQYEEGLATTRYIVYHESFKEFINAALNVDIIIFDYDYNEALLAIAQRFKCPVFVLALHTPNISLKRLIGNGYPITNLVFQKPISETGLFNALKNVWSNLHEKFLVDFYYQTQQDILYDQVLKQLQITQKIDPQKYIAKFFTNSLSTPVVSVAKVENLPILHIPEKSIFEYFVFDSLDKFIHSSEQGCIYVSLGPDTDPATLPKEKIYKMFQVFNERSEKIIWSWNGNTTLFGGSNKFFISKWLPQDDILRHRNIKAIVTNGGSLSIQEAIYHEIPVIGIPLTYQQRDNIDLLVEKGLGVKIELSNLTVESLIWGLDEIVDNKVYKRQLAFEADLVKNQLMNPIKVLKYWILYFYQHRHDDMPTVTQLSVIDFYLSDIYLPLVLILCLILAFTVISCQFIYKLTKRLFNKRKQKLY